MQTASNFEKAMAKALRAEGTKQIQSVGSANEKPYQ